MKFPFPVYFAPHVPLELLNLRRNVDSKLDAPWFKDLCADIKKRGLASPLLVLHYANERLLKPVPMSVKVGQNRLRALREIGWKAAPCIIVCGKGSQPPVGFEFRPLNCLTEAQELLGDGTIGYEKYESLRINSAMIPEQGRFPTVTRRYFDNAEV